MNRRDGQEHLERRQARLEQGQAALRDERVAAQPLDVDGADRDAGQVRVAPDVVEVVHREHARQQRLEPAHPARHRRIGERRLRDEERDPGRIDRLAVGECVALRDRAGRPSQAARSADPSSSSMIRPDRSSWVRRLPDGRRGSGGASNAARTWSSKKWANGPWPTSWSSPAIRSVSTTSPSDGSGSPAAASVGAQARVERARPQPCLVHDPEAVGEARVLGRREDPARALELADPAHALEPGRVEQVLLGDVLVRQPGDRRLGRGSGAWSARRSRGSGR